MKMPLVSRRTALKAVGATALLPWLSEDGLAAFAEIQAKAAPPRPTVLTTAQYATVAALVEALIPADERSPGAREARVADYIDLLLGEAEAPLREQWLAGLGALDAEAGKRFGAPFVKLPEDQAAALLTDISRYETAPKPAADAALDIPRNEQPKPQPPQVDTLLGDVGRQRALERVALALEVAEALGLSDSGATMRYGRALCRLKEVWRRELESKGSSR